MTRRLRALALALALLGGCATASVVEELDPERSRGARSPGQRLALVGALPFALAFDVATLPLQAPALWLMMLPLRW